LARPTAENGSLSWPTPMAYSSKDSHAPGLTSLDIRARGLYPGNPRYWPTPTVSDGNGPGLHGTGGMDLRTQVSTMWATPTTVDARCLGAEAQQQRNSPPLNAQVIASPPGQVESPPGMVLNHLFVESLMGFPDAWTVLDASEMQLFRKSRRSRGQR